MPKLKVHPQQFTLKQRNAEDLVARREELKESIAEKRIRLQAGRNVLRDNGFVGGSLESWQKQEKAKLTTHRICQELEREIQAEGEELDRLNKRLQALDLPYGAVGAMIKAERRKR